MTLESLLDELSEEQREAVTSVGRPLMIVAGAGTGKTRVLTSRIVWLVLTGQAKPEEILALTFTDKAAQEMSERLDLMLPQGQRGVEVGTFHALCDRLLRRHALEIGLDADFSVLSSAQARLLLRESLFALPLDRYRPRQDPLSYLGALARHFDKAKNEGIRATDYLGFVHRLERELEEGGDPALWDRCQRQRELAGSYQVYQQLMESRGYLDFGDQLLRTVELLRESPHLLQSLRSRFRYLLVDEFQDTNRAQFELVQLLAGDGTNLTVVGDDDQAIYSFRGATLANVLNFEQHFPQARQLVLRQNYRSLQAILDLAYRSIVHNNPRRLEVQHGLDKRLRQARTHLTPLGDEAVEVRTFAAVSDEADAVAERIEQLMATAAADYSDCAILVRNNRDANVYLAALESRAIPYRFQGSHGLYERPEVKLLLAFAKLISNPRDSLSCHHLAASSLFGLGSMKLLSLNAFARQQSLSLYDALLEHRTETPPDGVKLEAVERHRLVAFLDCLEEMAERLLELSPRALLHAFLVRSGWMARLASDRSPAVVAEARNLTRFFDIVRAHGALFPQDRLPQLVEHLELLRQTGDSPPTVESEHEQSAVAILTIHGSKGLEFPAVFLVGLSARRFPSWRREDLLEFPDELLAHPSASPEDDHVAEERRLFYVALTRAQRLLWLSMAFDEGSKRSQQISPFLREALADQTIDFRPQQRSPVEELMRHAAAPTEDSLSWSRLPADRPLRLSWRKLDLYWSCPRKYFYQDVLQLSVPATHQVSYGQALHEAVTSILVLKMRGVRASLEEVQAAFRTRWKRAGYLSADHLESDLARGLAAIEAFWRAEQGRPAPHFVERDFRVHLLENNWLTGRWDRVDQVDGRWSITDYKTSEVAGLEQAEQRARDSKQLVLYAMALEGTVGERPAEVALEFLGSELRGACVPEERDFSRLRGDIRRAALGIRNRDYTPTPAYRTCQSCAFRQYCDESAVPG